MNQAKLHRDNMEEIRERLENTIVQSTVETMYDGEDCFITVIQKNNETGNKSEWSFCVDFGTGKVMMLEPVEDVESFSNDNEVFRIIKNFLNGGTSREKRRNRLDYDSGKPIKITGKGNKIGSAKKPIKSSVDLETVANEMAQKLKNRGIDATVEQDRYEGVNCYRVSCPESNSIKKGFMNDVFFEFVDKYEKEGIAFEKDDNGTFYGEDLILMNGEDWWIDSSVKKPIKSDKQYTVKILSIPVDGNGDWRNAKTRYYKGGRFDSEEPQYLSKERAEEIAYDLKHDEQLKDGFGGERYNIKIEEITSSHNPIKSGYYDDPVNHPEGGGLCDNCNGEVEPGDGYEADFESSRYIALEGIVEAFNLGNVDIEDSYSRRQLAEWLGLEDEDELFDVTVDICNTAFEGKDYVCPDCARKLIKQAAKEWANDNYEMGCIRNNYSLDKIFSRVEGETWTDNSGKTWMYREGVPDKKLDYDVNADIPEREKYHAYKMFVTKYDPNNKRTWNEKGKLYPLYINAKNYYEVGPWYKCGYGASQVLVDEFTHEPLYDENGKNESKKLRKGFSFQTRWTRWRITTYAA